MVKNFGSWVYDYFFNAQTILSSRRLAWIDYAKGIAIVLVVYHHVFLGLESAGLKVNTWLINANLIVYSFRMPLFFILSGLFIQRGLDKRGLSKYIGYRSKILLYPYLLWAFLQIIIGYFFQSHTNFPWSWKLFLFVFYEPKYTSQFWYLIALYNASVLYVLMQVKFRIRGIYPLLIGIVLYLLAPVLSFNSMLQQLAINYVYLVLGTLLSGFILNKENFRLFSSPKIFFILLPFFILSQLYWINHESIDPFFITYEGSGIDFHWWAQQDLNMIIYFIIVMVGCAFTVNICFMLEKINKWSFIRVIGYHSLYIYLMHILFAVACRMLLVDILGFSNTYIILPVQIAFSVLGPVMVYNLCQHLDMNFLFEFDPPEFKTFYHRLRVAVIP